MSRTTEPCGCKHDGGRWLLACPDCYAAAIIHREALRAAGYPMPKGVLGLPPRHVGAAKGLV